MHQEFNGFRSLDDNTLRGDTRSPKSPLDHLDLATRHTIFFRKVEDQNSPKGLLGDNSQKHGDINQQNEVAKERKESKENSCTADESLIQAKMGKQEGFVSTIDSAQTPKRESSGSHWETVKLLAGKSLTRLANEAVGRAWQMLSEKSLTQCAKETVEWTWQNGVKALSWKKCMRLLVTYLAVSAPFATNAVKIYGKNGCSMDSHLIIDEHPRGYKNARRIVKERFEQTFPKLVERYAKDPCNKQYEKIHVTFQPHLSGALGYIVRNDPTHVFLDPIESKHTREDSSLGATTVHEFSHVTQNFMVSSPFMIEDYSALRWLEEALACYNVLIYGTKQDTQHWRVSPNRWSYERYTESSKKASGFVLWLDKKFPGFVDRSYQMAQEKLISWNDLEKLAGGQSLERLWQKYKKINFATEMSPFLEEQRRKYLESDQPDSYRPDRDLTENTEEESDTEHTGDAERTKGTRNINIAIMIIFAYMVYKIVKRQNRSNIGGWAQERQGWQGHYPQYPPHLGHIGEWAQERQGWQGHYPQYPPHLDHIGEWAQERRGWQGHYPQYPPHLDHIGEWAQERRGWQGHYPQYPPHLGHIGGWAQERQGWQEPDDAEAMRMWNQFREWIAY
jgi:hypothetical protein